MGAPTAIAGIPPGTAVAAPAVSRRLEVYANGAAGHEGMS